MISNQVIETKPSNLARTIPGFFFLALQIVILVLLQWQTTSALIDWAILRLPSSFTQNGWQYGYTGHFIQCLVALGIMAVLKPFFPGSFGLCRPRTRSYVWPALWIGSLGGCLMLLVDYYPQLSTRHPPPGPYSTNPGNMIPWLLMQGIFVGITEELPFRSLFLGYALQRYPATIKISRLEVSWVGILMAAVFALAHADAFRREPLASAIGQQLYVFLYGVFYAYLFERSGSVLAPIVAHNAGDCVEWSFCFLLRSIWR